MGTERTVAEPGQASSSRGFQRGRLAVSLVALLLGLVPAGSVHPQSPTPSPGDGLWVAGVNGLAKVSLVDGAVLLRIAEPRPVRLVAVDDASGRVWAFATDTLVAFDPTGQRLLGVPVPPAPLTSLLHQALAVDPATGGVWLALAQRLYRFDAAGRLLVTAGLPDLVQGLAVDPAGARLWVATRSSVAPYDAGGHRGSPLDLGGRRDVESVAIDQASGDLWVGLRDGLRRHRAAGSLLFEVPIGGLAHLADDGASGLWTATLNRLRRLDPAGHVLVEHRPFADGIVITAVAPDPSDHSVWVSGLLTLLHVGAAGQRLTGPTTPDLILDLALLRPAGAANQPPVARDDTATTPEDAAVTIPVLANDTDPDGDALTVTAVSQGARGTVTIGPAGANVIYAPAPNTSGPDTFTYTISDDRGGTATASVAVTVTPVNDPPVAVDDTATTPEDTPVTITVLGNDTDPDGDALTVAGVTQSAHGAVTFGPTTVTYTPDANFHGAVSFTYTARDPAGATATATVRITVTPVNDAPTVTLGADPVTGSVPLAVAFTATASDVDGDVLTYAWDFGDGTLLPSGGPSQTHTYQSAGSFTARVTVSDGQASATATVVIAPAAPSGLPPDPATVAPPLDRSVATDLLAASQFLFTGSNPIQSGVAPGVIEPRRVAVLRGTVQARDGAALPGVIIGIHGHPEFGQTLSRADGMFDLAVNGGGLLLVDYAKAGFLSAQRQVQAPWKDYAFLPDVALLPLDTQVSAIDLASSQTMQVARGSTMTDADGARQATLLFPGGTGATMVFPDGSTQPLTRLSVRATEYTVGPNGPKAMPAELPPTSGYTYAVEFSVDEAKAAGAIDVRFSSPLPFYVENFLGFPTGTGVPLGSYNRARGAWVPSDNGRVVKILGVTGGLADLDLDGDGIADAASALAALGITDAERQQLAALYQPGQSLWRVLIPHFDDIWDANWGIFCRPPTCSAPPRDPDLHEDRDNTCPEAGSVIECQNQILGEALGVVGTPFQLHYQSDREPGRNIAYKVEIPLSDAQLPDGVIRIELEVRVAGQFHKQSFPAAPNQRTSFTWNGENAYGQVVQGQQPITVRVSYTYPAEYGSTDRFGHDAGDAITGSRSRMEITMWRTWRDLVGAFDVRGIGLGGWSLGPHHTYIPLDKVVYRGDGGRQTARTMPSTISTVVGTGSCGLAGDGGLATQAPICPEGLAFGPDGSLYIAEPLINRIRRVAPDGIITTVAGNTNPCSSEPCGDGGPATLAQLASPFAVAVGPDNSLYISQVRSGQAKVRKVGPDGIITTLAGTGTSGFSGDGGPGPLAQVGTVLSLAVGPDGSVYLVDQTSFRIRRVGPDGIIDTVVGTGVSGFSGDGGPATRAQLVAARGIAVGQDGSLYIADHVRVRRVTPDGVIRSIAGNGSAGFTGDGGPATQASFGVLTAVAVAPDDTIYVADSDHFRIRWMRPGGTINTLAGTIERGTSGDGGPARQAKLQDIDSGLAVGPDGGIYFAQTANDTRVRRISLVFDAFLAADGNGYLVPSPDGSEVYLFSLSGQHLRTIDALTGVVRHEFAYDGAGRLASITDRNGNVTTIEHDGSGNPTAIVGPFGQRTVLAVNADGYLNRVTSPAGTVVQADYTSTGLLTSLTNPRGQTTRYTFDVDGFLTSATDPTGAIKTFARSGTNSDYTVTMTTALGRTTTYRVEELDNRDVRQTTTDPSGAQNVAFIGSDGVHTMTFADGTTLKTVLAPGPRWGMLAPFAASQILTTPGGLVRTATAQRTVTLGAPNDPLSLRTRTDTRSINGRVSTATFDAPSRTLTSTSAAGRRSTVVVDDRARPVQRQFGDLAPVGIAYDMRGRPATLTQGGRVTSFTYGSDGFVASLSDASGRTVAVARDADGRVTEETLPDGRVVRFAYDLNGNVRTLTPPGRPDHTFSYTPRDEIATYIPPAVGAENDQEQYSYNTDRQPLRVTRADGQTVQFQYDTAGRLNLLDLVSGDRSYAYDAAGRLTSLTAPLLTMTYTYDGGLSTASTWSGDIAGSVTRTFDNDFRVSSHRVDGANPVAIQYDADSLPTQVGAMSLIRSTQTELITAAAVGSLTDSRSFDTFGDLIAYAASHSGSAVYALDMTRDALGRITSKTETLGGATHVFSYTYDVAGRLTEVRQDGLPTESYTYDGNDNRLTGPDATITYSYDAQDRLAQRSGLGTRDYTHTPNGELQSKTSASATTVYQYDSLGNLSSVRLPNGTKIAYVLDAGGRRIGKRVDGTLVQAFLYQDGLRPSAELDGGGTMVSRFVYGTGRSVPAYLMKGGATYRIISDHVGSPRLVVDAATGQIAQRLDYDTFGNVTLDTNPGFQPFGFAGGLYDRDTQLVHFGAREYDPETGRWTAKDPGGFVSGPNLYIYANNDPTNLIDPLGTGPEGPTFWEELFAEEEVTEVADMAEIWKDDPRWKAASKAERLRAARQQGEIRRVGQMFERRDGIPTRQPYVDENSCPPGRRNQGGFAAAETNWLVVAFLFGYEYGTLLNNQFNMSGTSVDEGRRAMAWAEANGANPQLALAVGALVAGQSASAKTAYHVATFGTLGGLLIERLWE